ncbi:choline uptake/conversion transcriptional regulator CudC [Mechercharimyces sp. CAU 1602]|uniref:choline uptake/conversion transcriptional regulator CudC n=1 Tax=Mechercharimyces sp. CAU 1602 TaxID=2973933 RepID=UPI002161C9D2|nr:GbsR/MarR family transcriptional regulator [Mechercharimyces sp. CAU 1602]MCS1350698.1 GbsR/MarR family transcriptional regulator [Mechercharimyces sp. CAU 1602]
MNILPFNQKLEEARRDYIESLAETMEMYGLSPSMGRLYGTMFLQEEPMTLDEMCHLTGMSKTSMSTGVRALSSLKLVHKKWRKGVRKDLYEAEYDQMRSFVDFFCQLWEKEIQLNDKAIQETESHLAELLADDELASEDRIRAKKNLEKIQHSKEYYAWLRHLVDAFESGDIFEFIPIPTDTTARKD